MSMDIGGALLGGVASAATGYGLSKLFSPKPAPAPHFEMPKFEMPKFEAPVYEAPKFEMPKFVAPEYKAPEFTFNLPKYDEPVQRPVDVPADKPPPTPETPKPTPPPAAPIDASVTNAAIIARNKATEDAAPANNQDIVLTLAKDRNKQLAEGQTRKNKLTGTRPTLLG